MNLFFNEIHAMVVAVDMMAKYEIPLSIENLKSRRQHLAFDVGTC